MIKTLPTLAFLVAASPALAHPGVHIHPHADSALPVLAGLAVVAIAAYLMWRAQ